MVGREEESETQIFQKEEKLLVVNYVIRIVNTIFVKASWTGLYNSDIIVNYSIIKAKDN